QDKEVAAVMEVLEQFIGSQRNYITALKDRNYESLPDWPLEMSRFQAVLKRLFSALDQKMTQAVREQLEVLIALAVSQADEIAALGSRRHKELALSLPRLRRGKSALRGYGNLAGQRPAEFLSSSG
ncbi:hypothetical protein MNBD_DELTA03-47, partial [hydrothermal vent metagenome]